VHLAALLAFWNGRFSRSPELESGSRFPEPLHHLPALPEDLEKTFSEMQRVLRKGGRVVFVEPWLTPFLRFVHAVSENRLARRLSNKMDALAAMIQFERRTYEQWLT